MQPAPRAAAAVRQARRLDAASRPAPISRSDQPKAPPPPLGALTVKLVEATAELPPAGAVVRAFAAKELI
jgi:hypothetical protein